MANLTSNGKSMHGNVLKVTTVHFSLSGFMRYYPVLILSHFSLRCFSAGCGLKTYKAQLVGLPYHSAGPLQFFLLISLFNSEGWLYKINVCYIKSLFLLKQKSNTVYEKFCCSSNRADYLKAIRTFLFEGYCT